MPVVEHDWELFRGVLRILPFSSAQSGAATMAVVMALYRHVEERTLGAVTEPRCGYWLETNPEVPPGDWFKRFPEMTVCGEGELIKTFLRLRQIAEGDEVV